MQTAAEFDAWCVVPSDMVPAWVSVHKDPQDHSRCLRDCSPLSISTPGPVTCQISHRTMKGGSLPLSAPLQRWCLPRTGCSKGEKPRATPRACSQVIREFRNRQAPNFSARFTCCSACCSTQHSLCGFHVLFCSTLCRFHTLSRVVHIQFLSTSKDMFC